MRKGFNSKAIRDMAIGECGYTMHWAGSKEWLGLKKSAISLDFPVYPEQHGSADAVILRKSTNVFELNGDTFYAEIVSKNKPNTSSLHTYEFRVHKEGISTVEKMVPGTKSVEVYTGWLNVKHSSIGNYETSVETVYFSWPEYIIFKADCDADNPAPFIRECWFDICGILDGRLAALHSLYRTAQETYRAGIPQNSTNQKEE